MDKQLWMGVATTVRPRQRATARGQMSIRPPLHYCRMASAALTEGLRFLLFDPKDLRSNATVRGWTPKDAHQVFGPWVEISSRLPDVIYENVFVHLAVQGYSAQLRRAAKARNIPLFNPVLPGKWRMTTLMQNSRLKHYLPETEVLGNRAHALERIRSWTSTYVKPIGGYGGLGVHRVENLGNGRFRICVDRTKSGTKAKRRVVNREELSKWLGQFPTRTHLVQQGIELLTLRERRLDFRVVTQRDGDGAWHVVGIVPKMAAADGVVTNLIAGGESLTLARAQELARREGKALNVEALTDCALDVSEMLGRRYPTCGLVGFDIGLDESGKVWMIEMNPKPARSLLTDEMRSLAAKYSVEFAKFLVTKEAAKHKR